MTDTIAITPGSGATVSTDDRGALGHVQRMTDTGGTAVDAGTDATVTTSAESVAARDTRKRITFRTPKTNTANVLVGATGDEVFPIDPNGALTLHTTAQIFYKSASGTQTLYWIEEYDA